MILGIEVPSSPCQCEQLVCMYQTSTVKINLVISNSLHLLNHAQWVTETEFNTQNCPLLDSWATRNAPPTSNTSVCIYAHKSYVTVTTILHMTATAPVSPGLFHLLHPLSLLHLLSPLRTHTCTHTRLTPTF